MDTNIIERDAVAQAAALPYSVLCSKCSAECEANPKKLTAATCSCSFDCGEAVTSSVTDFSAFAEKVLSYSHAGLLERIEEKLGLTSVEAVALQIDMLRFLALCGYQDPNGQKVVLAPPKAIDEAWHHFILFTYDYAAFCQDHFGVFVHHQPFTKAERATGDGKIGPRTIDLARSMYVKLSTNWASTIAVCDGDGGGCAPSGYA